MARRQVKCLYCGNSFYREDEPYQKIGRRYCHQKCYEDNYNEEDLYKDKIFELVKELYGKEYNYQAIEAQRKKFLKDKMTNKGIYLTLEYYYKIKKNSIVGSDGRIGIVPYIYQEASNYYSKQEKIKETVEKIVDPSEKIRRVYFDAEKIKEREKKKKDIFKVDMNFL